MMLSLVITRDPEPNPTCTEGTLVADDLTLRTLELPRGDGLPGSAIPPGTYPVVLAPSPKFEASVDAWVAQYAASIPHIINIPNRTNILIHWGNTVKDTDGCVLVGLVNELDFIGRSREAFGALHDKMVAADSIQITIV